MICFFFLFYVLCARTLHSSFFLDVLIVYCTEYIAYFRLFTSEGDLLDTMSHPLQEDGSTPFLMDVTVLSHSPLSFVSIGEDASCIVWSNGNALQSIPHPCSLWCVTALPNGDFLTGGHDGIVRIFSQDSSRTSSELSLAHQLNFESEVAEALRRKKSGPSEEDLAKAPKWELASSKPGTSEGQVGVFNKSGRLIAAQWSSASSIWVEMGEVVGAPDGKKEEVFGVPYDIVLPCEMEVPSGGVQTLKIGYNNGENPFLAASRFIEQNNLNQSFVNEVADWIIQRTGQQQQTPTLDMSAAPTSNITPSFLVI